LAALDQGGKLIFNGEYVVRVFVSGGAGFVGSHLVERLLGQEDPSHVTVYDNFSSGTMWHLNSVAHDPRLEIVRGDIKELSRLSKAMDGVDVVYHLASNPDIAKAAVQPDIDFWEGTYLTQNVLEAARVNKVKEVIYTSGSGVYGEKGVKSLAEDHGPMVPISTYAASKLAGEALMCAYAHLFGISCIAFRFGNIVGPRQTHGVAYDFIRRLRKDPSRLTILGDGNQTKSYIHIDDVLGAIFWAMERKDAVYDVFNVATDDYVSVKEIADMVVEEVGLRSVQYHFTGGDRGWNGDVPVVRFDLTKIHALGWRAARTSAEALRDSMRAIIADVASP
jgi:UDP-glucose 4-epimerase